MPINDIGPLDLLSRLLINVPLGLSVLKSYPIPPPICIVFAAFLAASMMPFMLSSIVADTKQLYGVTLRGAPIAD